MSGCVLFVQYQPRYNWTTSIICHKIILLFYSGGGDLQSGDLLTCGHCDTKFPITELVSYIQHKATDCQKQVLTSLEFKH